MRTVLILGTVLEIMKSAFSVGLRSAAGSVGALFKPVERKANPYITMQMGYSILSNCFTWVTFFRDAILAIGVYLSYVYDKELNVIGGTWRTLGVITCIVGVLNTIMEFLKVINFGFFNDKSDFTYYVFLLSYTAWLFLFGMHCSSLVASEEKGMLDSDVSSGAEVDDDEPAPLPPPREEEASEEEKAPRKKKRKHRKADLSDDDV